MIGRLLEVEKLRLEKIKLELEIEKLRKVLNLDIS